MTSIVVGSVALLMHGISLNRKHSDIDILCEQADYDDFIDRHIDKIVTIHNTRRGYAVFMVGSKPIEFKIIDPNPLGIVLQDIILKEKRYLKKNGILYATPEVILTMKMTHRFLKNAPSFKKTLDDIGSLRLAGIKVPESLMEWMIAREKETLDYKHPNLNQNKKDFFSEGTFYKFDHDSIHRAIAIGSVPAYTLFKDPNCEVKCSKELWDKISYKDQLNAGVEESMVLALERHQIPNDYKPNPEVSFKIALEKVCTSITSGWFREFCWSNYYPILAEFEYWQNKRGCYVDIFKKALDEGKILPFYGDVE